MPSQLVHFAGSQNGVQLAGRLDTPDSLGADTPVTAWALLAHCFTCSKDSKGSAYIARALAAAGFGVLRFDFTGLGGSDGEFANTHFSSNIDDLVAAANWLAREYGSPSLLIGHSLGGAAVIAAAHQIASCRAVATLGAPFDPAHVTHQFGADLQHIAEQGQAQVLLGGRSFNIKKAFLDDLEMQAQSQRIRGLRRALLVMHAPHDSVVEVDNARKIFELAQHPKSFISLDKADHLLSRADDASYAANLIAAWAKRYI